MSDSGRLMNACEHGESGYCSKCLRQVLGVQYMEDAESVVVALKKAAITEDAIIRLARVLCPRDQKMVGDDDKNAYLQEPGASIPVDADFEFIKSRYMFYAHGDGPLCDFTSAQIFAVRDWLSMIFGVPVTKETPESWRKKEKERVSHLRFSD
jgi:hypothetical protein